MKSQIRRHYPRWVHGSKELQLYSRIVVQYDEKGRIALIQELWRGVPLLETLPFALARRANGFVSQHLLPGARHFISLRAQAGME